MELNESQTRALLINPQLRAARWKLDDPPLTIFGRNAVERFFTPAEIKEIVTLAEQLAA